MTLKETYEKMSDEELLEKFKHFQRYRDESKLIILEELRKRKLVGEKEIDYKLEEIRKIEAEKIINKEPEINKKNSEKVYKESTINLSYVGRFVLIFLLFGMIALNEFFFATIGGISTLFWEPTKAQIIDIEKTNKIITKNHESETITLHKITYKYSVNEAEYYNNRIYPIKRDDGYGAKYIAKNYSEGDYVSIYYNRKNTYESVIYRYDSNNFWLLPVGLILITIFIIFTKKAENEYELEVKKDVIIKIVLFIEVVILIFFLT